MMTSQKPGHTRETLYDRIPYSTILLLKVGPNEYFMAEIRLE
jgi:hypothetical protein